MLKTGVLCAVVFVVLTASAVEAQCVRCIYYDLCGGGMRLYCTFIENGCFSYGSCGGAAASCPTQSSEYEVVSVELNGAPSALLAQSRAIDAPPTSQLPGLHSPLGLAAVRRPDSAILRQEVPW